MLAVITGGSSGIGFETAKGLSLKGYDVIIIGRDERKCQEACLQIRAVGGGKASFKVTNLSAQKDIRKICSEFLLELEKIDVLINNAGQVLGEFKWSADHIEMQFATNHLAPFLLSGLLLPLLEKADRARIVNVSSISHFDGVMNQEDLNYERNYGWNKAYSQSKLCNVLFTYYLAEKLKSKGITVNCLHPGLVKTKIGNKSDTWWTSIGWSLMSMFGISVEAGAQTSIYLASSPEVKDLTAKYFVKCEAKNSAELSYDKDLQHWLWQQSESLTGFQYSF